MGTDYIDLTLSDDECAHPAKRPRPFSRPSSGGAGPSRATRLDDEVLIVSEEQQAAAAPRADVDLGDDEELAIIAEAGEVWNADLPHTRDLCGVYPFKKRGGASNREHCPKCYCYVCDCLALECQQWGTGVVVHHHCNAHSGDQCYKLMRAQRKKSQQENRSMNAAAAAAAATAAQRRPGSAAAAAGLAGAAAAAAAAVAPPVYNVLRLGGRGRFPDDDYDDMDEDMYEDMYEDEEMYGDEYEDEEAEVGLNYLAGLFGGPSRAGGTAAARMARKANEPCNLVEMPDPRTDPSLVHLATLEMQCKAVNGLTIPAIIKRLAPNGFYLGVDVRNQHHGDRLCIDNLFDKAYDSVSLTMVSKDLELAPLPLPPPPAEPGPTRVRRVTIFHHDGREGPTTHGVVVGREASIEEIMQAAKPLAGLARDEEFLAVDLAEARAGLSPIAAGTKISDCKSKRMSIGLWRLPKRTKTGTDYPSFVVIYHKKHNRPEDYPEYSPVGRPTVLPLGAKYANGGRAAERVVLERLVRALAPLRKEGTPPAQVDDLLGPGMRLRRTSQHAPSYPGNLEPFSVDKPYNERDLWYGERSFVDGRLFLRLEWSEAQLEQYNLDLWARPAVHSSASHASMKETEDYIKEYEQWSAQEARAKALPARVMQELTVAAKMKQPGVGYSSYLMHVNPLVRLRLDLRPDSQADEEVNGRLSTSVFVWRSNGARNRTFFKAHDEWETGKALRAAENDGPQALSAVMEFLLWDNPEYAALKARIDEWTAKGFSARHSIKGLMEVLERGELPAAPQPAGLTVQMRPYQLQSLQFMLDCERGEGGFRRFFWLPMLTPRGERWWYSPLLHRASFAVPAMPWGGFCCEEMGLGKTVEMLGLVLANPAPPLPAGVHKDADGYIKTRATLVVCAVSLVGQWMAEAHQKLGGSLRVYMYHGLGRIRSPEELATQYDIVVTTYATLNADFQGRVGGKGEGKGEGKGAKAEKQPAPVVNGRNANKFPPLGAIRWHRLVLDEAHTVKNTTVGHTRASMALQSERRWLCSGTPINTDVSDLLGQFCVLGMSPFNNNYYFNTHIKPAYGPHAHSAGGCPSLLYTLGQCMIRHTKKQTLGGEEVLSLPPLQQEDVQVVLTAEEQKLYLDAHARSKALFLHYLQLGNHQISRHLLQIMALLLPMRRVCSGGTLKPKDLEVSDPLFGSGGRHAAGAGADLADHDLALVAPEEECAVCMDNFEAPCITPCSHWFCRECILSVINNNPKCPLCRAVLQAHQLRTGVTAAEAAAAAAPAGGEESGGSEGTEGGRQGEAQAQAAMSSESKLQALLKELRAMRRADPGAKALIFSQYMSTIEWLKMRLVEEGFGFRYISGSMPLKQRAKAIDQFQNDPPTTVFLLSMRSGSVGINLTAASHVFLMEPALNPALEDQAVGRSWRMGQTRSVVVKRFYVKGSVEERIMEVVSARQHSAGGAGAGAGAAGEERGRRRNRTNVHVQDVAGSIQADRQQLRVSELEVLFQDPVFPPPRVPEPPRDDDDDEGDGPGSSRAHLQAGTGARPRRAAAARAAQQRQQQQRQQQQEEEEEEEPEERAGGTAGLEGPAPAAAAPSGAAAAAAGAGGSAGPRVGRGARMGRLRVRRPHGASAAAGSPGFSEGRPGESGTTDATGGGGSDYAPSDDERPASSAGQSDGTGSDEPE